MGTVAPILAGAGKVVEGVSANAAAGAESDMIGYNTKQQVAVTRDEYKRARSSQLVQAGATGLELTSGSFMDIFEESAVNQARTLADMKYAGKVQQAQVEQEGKNALIGGIIGGVSTAATGLLAQKQYKEMLNTQKQGVAGSGYQSVKDKVASGKIGSPEVGAGGLLKKRNLWSLNGPR